MATQRISIIRPRRLRGASLSQEELGSLTFDAVLRETSTDSGELTEYPVESGADRADHYRVRPRGLSLTGVLTGTPLADEPFGGRELRLHEALVALQRAGEPLTVATSVRTYTSMVITDIRTPRQGTSQALAVEVELRELLTATTQTITLPPELQRRGGAGRRNAGTQATRAATDVEGAFIESGADDLQRRHQAAEERSDAAVEITGEAVSGEES